MLNGEVKLKSLYKFLINSINVNSQKMDSKHTKISPVSFFKLEKEYIDDLVSEKINNIIPVSHLKHKTCNKQTELLSRNKTLAENNDNTLYKKQLSV